MKCPHCDYEDRILDDEFNLIEKGDSGSFFKLSLKMKRAYDSEDLHGCPSCGSVFMSSWRIGDE